jgi:hypothetical protein
MAKIGTERLVLEDLTMFDSLDEQMKMDEAKESTRTERVLRWTAVAIVSVIVFGGLYFGVRMLE